MRMRHVASSLAVLSLGLAGGVASGAEPDVRPSPAGQRVNPKDMQKLAGRPRMQVSASAPAPEQPPKAKRKRLANVRPQ
ncbi:MAG: hypothetical protein JNM07_07620 [Phycisphaerae bacterium]|nr:hypothetical protein [Phycisphaerae bacterium]